MNLSNEDIESRVNRARELFHQGFNCSQSVFASCADMYGMDEQTALRVSASFGGGIGRMRHVCGAASGMFLLAGMENGTTTPGDAEGKQANYTLVRQLADDFRTENGSIICAELLGLTQSEGDATPAPRDEAYYHKRPCEELVAIAVRIFLTH